jgi:hypothetical protein
MSSIAKIAVYDARLIQDPPAYAVQKGALSVSVQPFNAISANSSSMVFQVLVPSLNVFVDRKISLRATLNFTANLFYSGPRGLTSSYYTSYSGLATFIGDQMVLSVLPNPLPPVGSIVFFGGMAANATPNPPVSAINTAFRAKVVLAEAGEGTTYVIGVDQMLPFQGTETVVSLIFATPASYDAPDPAMGVRFDLSNNQTATGTSSTEAFLPLGYATAVSSKDLSYCLFPVQSCLSNMTATLNDCTVSTNGDTLHEQLILTGLRDTVKQRTTPSKYDTYAWGWDDANNGSGNFSSYSVVDTTGDVPNGAYPTIWFADASGAVPLSSITNVQAPAPEGSFTPETTGNYPFLPINTSASFDANNTANTGAGWYIARPSQSSVAGAGLINGGQVVVPFVDSQPVWTTAFPGGDLMSFGNPGIGVLYGKGVVGGFNIIQTTAEDERLSLLTDVPPYSMIGARLYISTQPTVAVQVIPVGWVSSLIGGELGKAGSQYGFVTNYPGGLFAINNQLALQGGFPVTSYAMPVFGAVSTIEPLVLSPLIFADSAEFQTVGLYGMTNMQFVLNFTSKLGSAKAIKQNISTATAVNAPVPYWTDDLSQPTSNTGNILRSSGIRTTISDLAYSSVANSINGCWVNPALFVTFLTPGPDVTLPLVSSVPYVEFPRYVLNSNVTLGQVGATVLATNTISLTSIPDMIMLYVKPATKGPSQLDTYLPINNVQISFDNFSNLCSGFQQFNLYESSVAAGLDVDWAQFRGYASGAANSYSLTTPASNRNIYKSQPVTQLSGAPLVLRMGHDVTLSPGLAPGCLGNYSIQCNIRVDNTYGFFDYVTGVTITLIAINTGFFETVRGQSAIRKTVLNSADVESAVPETGVSRSQLTRMVGRGMYNGSLSAGHTPEALGLVRAFGRTHGGGGGGGGSGNKRANFDMGGGNGMRSGL